MSIKAIDLFAGAGGTSTGAMQAGVDVVWAANHNPVAVEYHKRNHPDAMHACQDLHQADWSALPKHDIAYASPCCQGHSYAAGKAARSKKADVSRSTALAIPACADVWDQDIWIIENVASFRDWRLYPAWQFSMESLGYSLSENVVNAADLGVPQSRERLFIVATKSKNPIVLDLPKVERVSARSFMDLNPEGYKWDDVNTRVSATQKRVANGRKEFGELFLDAAYGTERSGRSLDKPLGTVTTVNKHSLVMGNQIRPLSIHEMAMAQTFPKDYVWPKGKTITKAMIGNAVPPLMAQRVTEAVLRAA